MFKKGNPQLRVFLPNFTMTLVKPEQTIPKNVVLFEISHEMTKQDVKSYLEKIYGVPVANVTVSFKLGKYNWGICSNSISRYLVCD